MYSTCVSSKLCEFICLVSTLYVVSHETIDMLQDSTLKKEQLTQAEPALCRQRRATCLQSEDFPRQSSHLRRMEQTQDNAAERKFWSTPELVEKLLPFLDPCSILSLCACFEEATVDRVVAEIENSWKTEDEWSVLEKVLNSAEEEENGWGVEEEVEDWTGMEQFLDLSEYQHEEDIWW